MNNKFLLLCCIPLSQLLYGQVGSYQSDTSPDDIITTVTDSARQINIGYNDNFKTLPALVFDTISETEFNTLKTGSWFSKINPEKEGDHFFVQTSLARHQFKTYKNYGGDDSWNGNELVGYYPKLKLYAITEQSTAEGFGFGQLSLLDSLTDYTYNIMSFGDGSVELPIPSVGNKYLVYYYNWIYDHKNSEIGVLKINDRKHPQRFLTEHASYSSTDFAIEEILWKTDNCFYIKGYEEVYEHEQWVKKYKYYQTTFR